ncbi:hypothetical protein [Neobacillus sp. 19]|uniref:hypothetical protein n=1 Tax=Neobacillus sp. 19 TaxID=3394458 RepID=UPI003BF74E16
MGFKQNEPANKDKKIIDMQFGEKFGVDTKTQIDTSKLPFFEETTKSFQFNNITLKKPIDWSYEHALSFHFLPVTGLMATLLTPDGQLGLLGGEIFSSDIKPKRMDTLVLNAAPFTTNSSEVLYFKRSNTKDEMLRLFQLTLSGPKDRGFVDIKAKSITWVCAEEGFFFLGYFDSREPSVSKAFGTI